MVVLLIVFTTWLLFIGMLKRTGFPISYFHRIQVWQSHWNVKWQTFLFTSHRKSEGVTSKMIVKFTCVHTSHTAVILTCQSTKFTGVTHNDDGSVQFKCLSKAWQPLFMPLATSLFDKSGCLLWEKWAHNIAADTLYLFRSKDSCDFMNNGPHYIRSYINLSKEAYIYIYFYVHTHSEKYGKVRLSKSGAWKGKKQK